MNTERLVTIPAFARMAGLNYLHALELVKRGDIPSVQVGPRRRINSRWIERWLDEGNAQPPDPLQIDQAELAKFAAGGI